MLGGYLEPELGGSPRHLDIVGINYYGHNQWEHQRPTNVLASHDVRRLPFAELLRRVHERYHAPILVSETASHGEFRASWLRDIGAECLRALEMGVDLQGLCIYPAIDMFPWHEEAGPLGMGLWELLREPETGVLRRVLHEPSWAEVRTLQARVAEHRTRTAWHTLVSIL